MFLEVYVVELGDVVLQFLLLEDLLDEVLAIVPSPRLVDLSEVLNDETALLYASLIDADGPLALRVNAEASLIFGHFVISSQQISIEVISFTEQLEWLGGQIFVSFLFLQLFLQRASCRYFSVSHDVLAGLIQVVPLSTHEIECPSQSVLDEVVSSSLVAHLLHSLNVEFRQTVVDDVAGEEVDAPSQSLLDLWRPFSVVFRLPCA